MELKMKRNRTMQGMITALGICAFTAAQSASALDAGSDCPQCGEVVRIQRHNAGDPANTLSGQVGEAPVAANLLPTDLDQSALLDGDHGPRADSRFEVHVQFDDGRREIRLVEVIDGYEIGDRLLPLVAEASLAQVDSAVPSSWGRWR